MGTDGPRRRTDRQPAAGGFQRLTTAVVLPDPRLIVDRGGGGGGTPPFPEGDALRIDDAAWREAHRAIRLAAFDLRTERRDSGRGHDRAGFTGTAALRVDPGAPAVAREVFGALVRFAGFCGPGERWRGRSASRRCWTRGLTRGTPRWPMGTPGRRWSGSRRLPPAGSASSPRAWLMAVTRLARWCGVGVGQPALRRLEPPGLGGYPDRDTGTAVGQLVSEELLGRNGQVLAVEGAARLRWRTVEHSVSAGGQRVATGTYTLAQLPDGGTRIAFEYAWQHNPWNEHVAAPIVRAVVRAAPTSGPCDASLSSSNTATGDGGARRDQPCSQRRSTLSTRVWVTGRGSYPHVLRVLRAPRLWCDRCRIPWPVPQPGRRPGSRRSAPRPPVGQASCSSRPSLVIMACWREHMIMRRPYSRTPTRLTPAEARVKRPCHSRAA